MAAAPQTPNGQEAVTARSRKARGIKYPKPKFAPNVVPLVDVMFMLLLFFILGTRFRQEEGIIPGTLPAIGGVSSGGPVFEPRTLTLRNSGTGVSYELQGAAVGLSSPEELYLQLASMHKATAGAEVSIIIKPLPSVPWGYVVEAFNQAVRAKFDKIGFAAVE